MTPPSRGFLTLDDPEALDAHRAGGKAAGLAALRQAGFRTPPGIVLPPDVPIPAPGPFAASLASLLPSVTGLYAVRSSADVEDGARQSYAGVHLTRLGVRIEHVSQAVDACRQSARARDARAYASRGGGAAARMAVLIQPMLRPRAAGVAFGADPVTGDRETLLIEAVPGLGEPLVSGRVAPWRYRVLMRGGRREIVSREPGDTREALVVCDGGVTRRELPPGSGSPLTDPDLDALADAVRRAGDLRKAPQDVEWAFDDSGLVLLQSRPITRLPEAPGTLWTRANLREVLPEIPSPLLRSFWETVQGGMTDYYETLGLEVRRWGDLARVIQGRIYFNATAIAKMNETLGVPPAFGEICLGHGLPPGGSGDPYAVRWGIAIRHWRIFLRIAVRQWRAGRVLRRGQRRLEDYMRSIPDASLAAWNDPQLRDRITAGLDILAGLMTSVFSVSGGLMAVLIRLGGLLRGRVDSVEGFVGCMTAPGAKTVTTEQGLDFLSLARQAAGDPRVRAYFDSASPPFRDHAAALAGTAFLDSLRRFLDRYGHRGIYETEIARPRFREDPGYLLSGLAEAARRPDLPDPARLERSRLREARAAWTSFTARLTRADRILPWRPIAVRMTLREVKRCQILRERIRFEAFRGMEAVRRLLRELERRWTARGILEKPGDIFYLRLEEIREAAVDASRAALLRAVAARRRAEEAGWRNGSLPNLLHEAPSGALIPVQARPDAADGESLRGLAVSPGIARGRAARVRTPDDFARMRPGAILVAPATDPAWSPLFALAAGVAVEMGGLLSHGSILAREYGIPAVTNVAGLLDRVQDGDWLEIDGGSGTVRILPADGASSRGAIPPS